MRISDFDYPLPDKLIAQHPPKVRGQSQLLALNKLSGELRDQKYTDITQYLQPGDVVVLNDTKVIKARLLAQNQAGKQRELLLIESHGEHSGRTHKAIYRGKLHAGEIIRVGKTPVTITKILEGGIAEITSSTDLYTLAEQVGTVPLPPYMKRDATKADTERYQTVFAQKAGSVAAPTASLNFTQNIVDELTTKDVKIVYLTLHVGLGTFLPIRTGDIKDHVMHSEYFEIPKTTIAAIQDAKRAGKHVLAVGTTVTRTLEYNAQAILRQPAQTLTGEADIFMYPGYEFQVVDMLLTNFHAPRTTVLMLAAAFAGWNNLQAAYLHAIENKYRFLSYGDSMLIY